MNKPGYVTEQETFWAGQFGDDYIHRNDDPALVAGNLALFGEILQHTHGISSIIEFGANVGMNLRALRQLLPSAHLASVEINAQAADRLRALGYVDVRQGSLLDDSTINQYDLAFSKGVLIHIAPDRLPDAYQALYASSRKYRCIIEYYNPYPVSLPYRGHSDRLFKRDFAGEMLDRFPCLKLVSYGFKYYRDPVFAHGDESWFLLERLPPR